MFGLVIIPTALAYVKRQVCELLKGRSSACEDLYSQPLFDVFLPSLVAVKSAHFMPFCAHFVFFALAILTVCDVSALLLHALCQFESVHSAYRLL